MLSHETIKRVAERYGYTFNDETCTDLLKDSYEGETVGEALLDYLSAYEGISDKAYKAILFDTEAEATR